MLPPDVLATIYAHAEACAPNEACGIVLAEHAEVGYPSPEVRRCDNAQDALHAMDPITYPRTSRTAFQLSAADSIALDASLATTRPARVLYHSHLDTDALLSDEDRAAAAPSGQLLWPLDYLVVEVRRGRARGAVLFRFDRDRFIELARFCAA